MSADSTDAGLEGDELAASLVINGPDLAEWLDDSTRPADLDRPGWRVDDDNAAAWAFRKLATLEADVERLNAQADDERARIDAWVADATSGASRGVTALTGHLVDYYRRVVDADPDTPKTYRVLGGRLSRRLTPGRLEVVAPDEVCELLEAVGLGDLVVTSTRVSARDVAAAIKDGRLVVTDDGSIITADGEPLPGLVQHAGADKYAAKTDR